MKIKYLHISDLHLSTEMKFDVIENSKIDCKDIVLHSLLLKLNELSSNNKFDFIIITGDIVKSGKIEEYKIAEIFFNEILKTTNLSKNFLFVVPGNHDIDRSEIKKSHLRRIYTFEKEFELNEILEDIDFMNILSRKLTNYNNFAKNMMGNDIFDNTNIFFVKQLSLLKNNDTVTVNLIGLNSVILSGYDGDDKKNLALGLHQVDGALRHIDDVNCINIAFFHHPITCLHDCDKPSINMLMDTNDLILTGHLHESDHIKILNNLGQTVFISAGASYETRKKENSFNYVEIDVKTGKGKIFFFKYLSSYNRWVNNHDINFNNENEFIMFDLGKKIDSPEINEECLDDLEEVELSSIKTEKIIINETMSKYILYDKLKSIILDKNIKRIIFEYTFELGDLANVKLNVLREILFESQYIYQYSNNHSNQDKRSIVIKGVNQKVISTYFGMHYIPNCYVLELDRKKCE